MSVRPEESDPWKIPGDADEFIRGGVHEPPASDRAEKAAKARDRRAHEDERLRVERSWSEEETPRRRGVVTVAVIGVLVLIVVVFAANLSVGAGLLGESTSASAPAAGGLQTPGTHLAVRDLSGSCYLQDRRLGGVLPLAANTLTHIDCAQSHDAQLILTGRSPNGDYPAADTWAGLMTQCQSAVTQFTGKDPSSYPAAWTTQVIHPTEQSWATGDRDLYCVVSFNPPQTGTIRAS